ncbi:MAG: 2-hydroxyacid dehydrogenase [Burkholderiales bacterium]
MKKTDILVAGPFYPPQLERLDCEFTTHKLWQASDRAAFLKERANSIRGIATTGFHGATAEVMDALPKVEIISCFGVGVDAIDLKAAAERKIIVTNTPEVLNDDVADLALALMLMASRRLAVGDRFVRDGKWLKGTQPLARKLTGKRLGILGLGRIGQAIAKRAEAFDMPIAYHNRKPVEGAKYRYYKDLAELAAESDFLVAICPGGAATKRIVSEKVMKALGPQGILVNVARGSVVDEAALVKCLQDGSLGGAGLDVFEDEPRAPEALFSMEQVVLAPHVGSATHESRNEMGRLTVDNLLAHFAGKPVLTPVG